MLNDNYGRRWAIFIGSWVMVFGALLQCFSNGGKCSASGPVDYSLTSSSGDVYRSTIVPRVRYSILYHRRFLFDGRTGIPKGTAYHDLLVQRVILCRCAGCCWHFIRYAEYPERLGMENTVSAAGGSLNVPDLLYFV